VSLESKRPPYECVLLSTMLALRGDMLWKLEIHGFRGFEIGALSQQRLFAAAFGSLPGANHNGRDDIGARL